jgi:ferritin-like metal-binding protein YciE
MGATRHARRRCPRCKIDWPTHVLVRCDTTNEGAARSPPVLDAALIAAAQRVEHSEIAAYGWLRTYAEILGYSQAAELLQETLEEEEKADETLTKVGEQGVNTLAAAVAGEEEEEEDDR